MPKGRPKISKVASEQRRLDIINIAKRLFLEEGYSSVSMRKIASEAGVSPMTLYQSFENKRELLRFIWSDIFIEVTKQCNTAIQKENNAKLRLKKFTKAFLQYWLENPEHYRVVYLESDQLENSEDSFFVDEAIIVDLFTLLENLITDIDNLDAKEKKERTQPIDTALKVKLLVLQLQGIAQGLITISEIEWGDPDELLNAALSSYDC